MEINGQQNTVSQTAVPVSSTDAQPVNQQETQAKESGLNTVSTVNISTEAQKLASENETTEKTAAISTKEEAEKSVSQFQQDAANDPSLTQAAQSNSLTSDQVSRLIG